jgi:serine/threonine protein kinase
VADTGDRIGAYEIVRLIARGGMATVYEAHQPALDRRVALKQLDLRVNDPSMLDRFIRESRIAASFDHPNIVTVYDFFESDGVPYIAMEYLPRGSLRPCVGDLSQVQVFGVLEGMLAALAHAEQHGVAHRDLKPENVLITRAGAVKIADFGIAKTYTHATSAFTATGIAVGTPTYMAPEQALAHQVGPYTDLYALGVIAHEMLSGGPPFTGGDSPMSLMYKHVSEPPPRLESVDPRLADWVASLLAKAPEDRPPGAAAAWSDLEEVVVDALGPYWRRTAGLPDSPPPDPSSSTVTPVPSVTSAPVEADDDGYETIVGGANPPDELVAEDESAVADEPVVVDEPEPEPVAAETAAPRTVPPPPAVHGGTRSPRGWLLAGVGGAVVVVAIVAVVMLGGGGDDGGPPGAAAARTPKAAAPYAFDGSTVSAVAGLPAARKVVIGGTGQPISGDGNEFGAAVASGDFDGDGKADLAIGGSDRVTVKYGPDETRSATFKTRGDGLAAGDLDGNGYVDLAAGGRDVRLLFGGPDGLTEKGARTLDPPGGGDVQGFGSVLAIGNVDGDKQPDIAEAGPDHSSVCHGGPDGPTACEVLGNGAAALAIGDVDGNGIGDIVQGVPSGSSAGLLRLWRGGGDLSAPITISQATKGVRGDNQAGDEFGAAVAVADLDGDGRADIVVGAPGESAPGKDDQTGRITLIRGGPRGHGKTDDEGIGERSKGLPLTLPDGARLGASLTLLDIDGDGTPDLIAAAPGAGKVITFPGADRAFSVAASQPVDVPSENGPVSLGAP